MGDKTPHKGQFSLFEISDSQCGRHNPEMIAFIEPSKDILKYSMGYLEACKKILGSVDTNFKADAVVFPLVFLFRHYVELSLKKIIILENKSLGGKNTHNIVELWSTAKPIIEKYFSGESETVVVESIITELSTKFNDPKGMVFRYPFDTRENKFIDKKHYINLVQVGEGIERVGDYFEGVIDGIIDIKQINKDAEHEI